MLTVSLATGATATLAGSATRVSGFADGAGAGTALFSGPGGLALDPVTTELLVGDTVNNAVRRIGSVAERRRLLFPIVHGDGLA